jgi:hypothetical protein
MLAAIIISQKIICSKHNSSRGINFLQYNQRSHIGIFIHIHNEAKKSRGPLFHARLNTSKIPFSGYAKIPSNFPLDLSRPVDKKWPNYRLSFFPSFLPTPAFSTSRQNKTHPNNTKKWAPGAQSHLYLATPCLITPIRRSVHVECSTASLGPSCVA